MLLSLSHGNQPITIMKTSSSSSASSSPSLPAVLLVIVSLLAGLVPRHAHSQAVHPGAGAVYFPKSRRALLFGGATRPTYFRTITSLDMSKPFATNAAPFSTLSSVQLPTGTQYLIPWVSSSGSDVALFGGIVSNATSSTSVNVNGVIPASAIYEAKVNNDGASVDAISTRQFVYNVQAPCYTLATIAGGVDDGKTYLFGGFSYFTNLETDELRVFDDSKSLKNVTVAPGSARPPRRQLGSLARLDSRRLMLSGGYQNNLPMADAWIYDLQTNTWSPAGNLTNARYNHQTVVVKPTGSSKSYIVQIGGDSARSLFEYTELPASGASGFNWKRAQSVEGKADLTYMVNQSPVVIGDQIVMFGVSLDPQQFDKFASVVVLKAKESSPGSLAFEWAENYVPAGGDDGKPTTGSGSATGGDTTSGGTSGGTSMTLVGILVGMAVVGVAVAGFLWFKRSKKNTAAQHKPLSNNASNSTVPPSGPPSVVSPQQPATVFAPAPNVHQQFTQQQPPVMQQQQQQQPAQLYQPQYQQPQPQQQPMVDNRMSYMSSSIPQPQPQQQAYDPRMSYMSAAQSQTPASYPQSPPPTSHLSGPAPYPAAQMPIAYLPPHPPQSPTPAFPVSGIAPPMGPPAPAAKPGDAADGADKLAGWYPGQQPQQGQQVFMMPQAPVQTVPSAPPAPGAPAQGMIMTSMPIPQQPVQHVQGEEEEVLYLGGQLPAQPAQTQQQQPGRPY
ncbi:hypothetical protein BCR44DRAFT_307270 [Catenaria anguillulae PL171]|uniref:Galactose oxidase n=1 Tax=Catenaria anguillulae PL171 TaxID=765915 RepID=A0A1Y2HUA2_9FUNG|nr:hypothetical protein BCR44DRAFT_307270 [Catenaria anguillulae PL171]